MKKYITNYYVPALINIVLIICVLQIWIGDKIIEKLIFITIIASIEIRYILTKVNKKE